jgi:GTPase
VSRSGFVAVIGRPNVGKSTLVNTMVGTKVSITSPRPNTTRFQIRGILERAGSQAILVDTPGVHRPRTALGTRLNESAAQALEDVDVTVAMVDATGGIGPGDRIVLARAVAAGAPVLVVVNKVDRARPSDVLERLASAKEELEALAADRPAARPVVAEAEYFPVSASTGKGVDPLVEAIFDRLPDGPAMYPEGMVSDQPEAVRIAELVREQLLARAREELPHSIACRVTEWEGPYIRCEILVERDSQKAIVIGRGGQVLKEVGTTVRAQLPPNTYLDLVVRVDRGWQRRDDALDRLGY